MADSSTQETLTSPELVSQAALFVDLNQAETKEQKESVSRALEDRGWSKNNMASLVNAYRAWRRAEELWQNAEPLPSRGRTEEGQEFIGNILETKEHTPQEIDILLDEMKKEDDRRVDETIRELKAREGVYAASGKGLSPLGVVTGAISELPHLKIHNAPDYEARRREYQEQIRSLWESGDINPRIARALQVKYGKKADAAGVLINIKPKNS